MPYTTKELENILQQLIRDWENEVVDFKRGGSGSSTHEIGKYFSALANEANLREIPCAWLVFGIDNKSRQVTGSDYRPDHDHLHSLKHQIAEDTKPSITLREIYELQTQRGRVIMFQIPPAPKGLPIAWKGHFYAREGESLGALGMDKLSDALDEKQKQNKINNLIAKLRKEGIICNTGSRKAPLWSLLS